MCLFLAYLIEFLRIVRSSFKGPNFYSRVHEKEVPHSGRAQSVHNTQKSLFRVKQFLCSPSSSTGYGPVRCYILKFEVVTSFYLFASVKVQYTSTKAQRPIHIIQCIVSPMCTLRRPVYMPPSYFHGSITCIVTS